MHLSGSWGITLANTLAYLPCGHVFKFPSRWEFTLNVTWSTKSTQPKMDTRKCLESKGSWCDYTISHVYWPIKYGTCNTYLIHTIVWKKFSLCVCTRHFSSTHECGWGYDRSINDVECKAALHTLLKLTLQIYLFSNLDNQQIEYVFC